MALATVLCFVLALMPARLSASRIKESKLTRKIVSRAAIQFASPTIPNESPDNVPRFFKFATPPLTFEDFPDSTKEKEAFEAFKPKAREAQNACMKYYAAFVCTGSASLPLASCTFGCGALWCGQQYSLMKKGELSDSTLKRLTAKCAEADLDTNFPEHAKIPEKE